MTKKKQEELEKIETPVNLEAKEIFVEVGPNLRAVLEKMVSKVEPSSSSTYLNVAFAPICYMLDNLVERKQNKEDSLL